MFITLLIVSYILLQVRHTMVCSMKREIVVSALCAVVRYIFSIMYYVHNLACVPALIVVITNTDMISSEKTVLQTISIIRIFGLMHLVLYFYFI